VEERTHPDHSPHYSIPEVVDLASNDSDSPEEQNHYTEKLFEEDARLNRAPVGPYKQDSVPVSSARAINSLPLADSSECSKHVLAAVENLSAQVEMLRKSMVLMEERLTLIEKTKHTVFSKHN
jgi:hypothetical protein